VSLALYMDVHVPAVITRTLANIANRVEHLPLR